MSSKSKVRFQVTSTKRQRVDPALSRFTSLVFAALVFAWALAASTPVTAQEGQTKVQGAILNAVQYSMVPTEVAGPIDTMHVKPGDFVKKGQMLGEIRSRGVELKLVRAKMEWESAKERAENDIELQVAKKSRDVANKELERAESANLAIKRTVSALEVDRLQLVADRALLSVQSEELRLRLNKLDLRVYENDVTQSEFLFSQFQIRSPINGRVASVEKQVGEWVEVGTDFSRIVDTSLLRVEGLIPASPYNLQMNGRKAIIRVTAGNGEMIQREGKVVFVGLDANPVSSMVKVWIDFDNRDQQLTPGLRVEAIIEGVSES
jgi:multidrug resistance efflux pump